MIRSTLFAQEQLKNYLNLNISQKSSKPLQNCTPANNIKAIFLSVKKTEVS
jgi:hypothetical protein